MRTGNGAYLQLQIDVYGQMLDLALMYKALGGQLTSSIGACSPPSPSSSPRIGVNPTRVSGKCAGRRAITSMAR